MSENSDTFVDGLKAAFPYTSKDTVSIYKRTLAKWRLTRKQWEDALIALISLETDGNPPLLATIFAEIKKQQYDAKTESNLGMASWKLNGTDYALRIKWDGAWVISDLVWTDRFGKQHHLQAHVGEPVVKHIPKDATDFLIAPDNPPRPAQDDIPSDLQRKELMAEIRANLATMGKL